MLERAVAPSAHIHLEAKPYIELRAAREPSSFCVFFSGSQPLGRN